MVGLGAVLVYAALQLALVIAHDPWLDEAQAWLVATSLTRPIDFLVLPSEGHPPLWHWLLRTLSLFFDYGQARYLSTVFAVINAVLLWRLLRATPLMLIMMLGSFAVLQSWGYHFRPYSIVFALLLSALLLDRNGRRQAATWCLAVACGFHFFSGILFSLWLVWQWHSGTPIRRLVAPSILAALFGASAVLSGLGNTTAGTTNPDILSAIVANLGWIGMAPNLRNGVTAAITLALLVFGLRSRPTLLATVLVLLVVFATGTALVYGRFPWHFAFMTMLCFTALAVAGLDRPRQWVLACLLLPQVAFSIPAIIQRAQNPDWAYPDLYQTILADAGAGFRPDRDLVAWPDMAGVSMAAVNDIQLINGNIGTVLGPVDWRQHHPEAFAPILRTKQSPYWLVCAGCEPVLDHLSQNGRTATLLATKFNVDNGRFDAYRID